MESVAQVLDWAIRIAGVGAFVWLAVVFVRKLLSLWADTILERRMAEFQTEAEKRKAELGADRTTQWRARQRNGEP